LAAEDLDVDACPLADGVDELGAIRRAAQPGRADGCDPSLAGLLDHRRDRVDGAADRLGREPPVVARALAEPRDLGPVDDRAPVVDEQKLDRVRADVDDGGAAHRLLSVSGTLTFGRPSSPSSRTPASTAAGSSDSTATVIATPAGVRSSDRSAMAPPTVKCSRRLCTSTARTPGSACNSASVVARSGTPRAPAATAAASSSSGS